MSTPIEQEYRDLLQSEGYAQLLEPPSRAKVRYFVEQLSPTEREFMGALVEEQVANDYRAEYVNPFDDLHAQLRTTMRDSGLEVPGTVYVGEYPHHAYNAQARRASTGTLILLNTGLQTLLDRVALVLSASLLTSERQADGSRREEPATAEQQRVRAQARVMLAESIVAYLSPGTVEPPVRLRLSLDERLAFGHLVMRAAEKFTIGHELGHLLAGHLHQPPAAGRVDREYEADELAALLLLRELNASTPPLLKFVTVAGPFVFLAIDHLVQRVQREVFDLPPALTKRTHPPSDQRAAVLRGLFAEYEGEAAFQVADACLTILSGMETEVVATARQLLDG